MKRRLSLLMALTTVGLLLFLPMALYADPPGKKPTELYSVTYNVTDIVKKKGLWTMDGMDGQPQPVDSLERVAQAVVGWVADVKEGKNLLGKNDPATLQLLQRDKLEIRTDKKTHEQIELLLHAMRNTLDLALVVDCWLFEVDRKAYEQHIAGKMNRHLGNPPVFVYPATDEFEMKFLQGKVDNKNPFFETLKPLKSRLKATLQNREQGEIFSWRAAVPYKSYAAGKKEIALVYPGFSFALAGTISSDRRKVQIQLTQKVTQVVEWKKESPKLWLPNQEFQDWERPILQESSFTSNFTVLDGWPVVAVVQGQKPGTQANDRVLVLLFTPRIRIEEEERAIQKTLADEKKK
jgi:hypothetical protein